MSSTTVTFDNASLADAVGKAGRIAPRKGDAFDKAAGLLISVNPAARTASVKAYDLTVSYEHNITLLDGRGDPAVWRIPSSILTGIVTNLAMGDGASIDFIDRGDPSCIRFKSGNMVAKIDLLKANEFPRVPTFDAMGMTSAQELAAKVEQVAWAVDPKSPILSGVHIDGSRLLATNRHVVATVACEVAIDTPVTVPLTMLAQLLKSASDVHIRAEGKQFQIMLDAETKVTTSVLEMPYPKIDGSILRDDFVGSALIHRQQFISTLERMMVMTQNEKSPTLSLEINADGMIKMLTFGMEIRGTGRMQDSIDIQANEFTGVFKIYFNPQILMDAVGQAKSETFVFDFGHADPAQSPLKQCRVTTDSGYTCYVMPKKAGD